MKHFSLLIFLLLLRSIPGFGQAVTTAPAFPTADAEVTLIFDLKQAKDPRAAGLLNKTSDVYLWSGAGTSEAANAFEFQPTGQTDFTKPFEPGKMTPLGNDRWQIKFVPRTYFNVPVGRPIVKMGLLLKSGNGTAQTEDFVVRVYENKLSVSRVAPTEKNFFVASGASIPFRGAASQKSTLTLLLDNNPVATQSNADTLAFSLAAGTQTGQRRTVVFRAQTATETAADTFFFTVRPTPPVEALPAGLKDGINYTGNDRATLVFFAPQKAFVYAIGEFSNWQALPQYLMKRTPDGNRYWLELTGLTAGQEVAFQYLVDGTLAVADPYADKVLDPNNDRFIPATTYPNLKPYPAGASGIVSVLQTAQPAYPWKVTNFQRPDAKNMVVYELLMRDFVGTQSYKTVSDTLAYLKRLGVNCIELMPIMEFSGNISWGYNPIFYFAPDKIYGSKNDLKAFIDKCHENGMAVILDMVLNQADYEFPYVKMYWDNNRPSATSPFFNQQATHPFSVFFDFNHESPATQAFVERVNRYWLEEFKFDGYRFDLSKGFTQKVTGGDVGAWGNYDASRVAIWKKYYDGIRAYDKTAYVMLEHFADNTEEKELADYGMLFWGNHNHDYLTLAKGYNANPDWISYKRRGWQNPHVVGYLESHDEERLMVDVLHNGKVDEDYNLRSQPIALDRAKLAAAFFLPVPGPKLIWQFGELGYDQSINRCPDGSINNNCRVDPKPARWEYQQDPNRRKLYRVYSELIKLKLTQPAFRTTDFTLDFANLVKRITLNDATNPVFIIGNFDTQPQAVTYGFPRTGKWYDYFSGQELDVTSAAQSGILQPGEFHIYTAQKLATPEAGLVSWGAPLPPVLAVEPGVEVVLVSPNPTADFVDLTIRSAYRGPVELTLTDGTGRTLRSLNAAKTTDSLRQAIPLHGLPTGLYFLRIGQGSQKMVRKVMKQ